MALEAARGAGRREGTEEAGGGAADSRDVEGGGFEEEEEEEEAILGEVDRAREGWPTPASLTREADCYVLLTGHSKSERM